MGQSLLERIAVNVQTTLGNVKTEAGYQLDIQRAKAKNEPEHLKGFIFQLPASPVDSPMTGTDERLQPFAVVVYVMPTEDDQTAVDTYNNDIAAALHTAIKTDYTRGGLAIDTVVEPTIYFPNVEGEYGGITFIFHIWYRTALDRPNVSLN